MYVGNDAEKDVEPAREVGMISVQMCRRGLNTVKSSRANFFVESTEEVNAILKNRMV